VGFRRSRRPGGCGAGCAPGTPGQPVGADRAGAVPRAAGGTGRALAAGTADLPATTAAAAEPVLLDMAGRLDPPGLRKLVAHLRDVADPDGEEARIERQHERRGLWLSPTLAGMVAIDGLLEPDAGETLLTALEPLARPASAEDDRSGSQRRADALTELARRALEGGLLPTAAASAPRSPSRWSWPACSAIAVCRAPMVALWGHWRW
jgi:Domain of unknown function (DUF222)